MKKSFFLGLPFSGQPSLSSRSVPLTCNFLPQFPENSLSERCVYRLLLKMRFSIWSSANSFKQSFLLLPFTKKKELPLQSTNANESTCRKIHCSCIFNIFKLKRKKKKGQLYIYSSTIFWCCMLEEDVSFKLNTQKKQWKTMIMWITDGLLF